MLNEYKKVYDPKDIRELLGLSKDRTYAYLEEVYQNKTPFMVIKVGKLYKIPKEPFNKWLNGEVA